MARQRGRPSKSSARASPKSTPISTPNRRTSGRLQSSAIKVTPKKSIYFEGGSDTSEDEPDSDAAADDSSEAYEEEASPSAPSTEDELAADDDEYSSGDDSSRKRKRGQSSKDHGSASKVSKSSRSTELWREGVKSHLAPGEEVRIKLPKAREAGDTRYEDHQIHPNTLLFLGDLKKHNEREWLKAHDADFRQAQNDFKSFVEKLTEKLVDIDETVPELPPKDIVFRIYRDVRFSSDPTPYKTHFSAAWSRTGKKGPYAAYYVQIAPGRSFVGGGLWCPEAAPLALLRQDVDQNSQGLKTVLGSQPLRSTFLDAKSEKNAVKAFCAQNKDNALKRHPKGYEEDNANIELLRLRNYTIGRKLKDEEVLGSKGLKTISELFGALNPFVTYLNGVVMPDLGQPDDEAESESEEGEED